MKLFKLSTLALLVQVASATLAAAPAPISLARAIPGADASVRPQDDLFLSVNGGWIKSTVIPPDQGAVYGADLPASAERQVRAIVDALARKPHRAGTIEQKIGDYYTSFLDTDAIDKAGLAPVQAVLAEIDAITNATQLAQWQGRMQGRLETPLWFRFVMPDFKNPAVNQAMTWQGGLGLPDRDYYLKLDDARFAKARAAYSAYLATLATLAGERDPGTIAAGVMAIEQRIALAHSDAADLRDPGQIYHPMTPAELATSAPGFDWIAFVEAAKLAPGERINVTQPALASALAKLYGEISLADWKRYFKMRTLAANASVLPDAFRGARVTFQAALSGATQASARWRDATEALNGALGEAVGEVYVARHFPPAHKARMRQMVDNLLAAYRDAIGKATWMTSATKAQALDKLSKYGTKIGYPDQWRDYSALTVRAGDALGNRARAKRFEWEQQAAKAGNPVDRGAWMMTPQTVNAYYDPLLNEIVFPAAFMQAPNFDMAADDATNYGAIGTEIGHEISHGFDDLGSQFNGFGVFQNWWTDADRKAFDGIGARLVAQFDGYQPLPGKHINGKLTLSENIADLAGAQVAYQAYLNTLKGKPAPIVGGLTGPQRFFLSWAKNRRMKARDELTLKWLTSDPHSPNQYRINGAAVNLDAFHDAFGTHAGDGMFKPAAERIRSW
jgi:putative endopeptidase